MSKEPTTERLAKALELSGAPAAMIAKAREGYYDDFKSPLATPIMQLVGDARRAHLNNIALRAMNGEFDSTKEESDEWAASAEGQETIGEILKGKQP